jgi:hypothetical protein
MDCQGWSDHEDESQATSDFGSDDSTPFYTSLKSVSFYHILPYADGFQ